MTRLCGTRPWRPSVRCMHADAPLSPFACMLTAVTTHRLGRRLDRQGRDHHSRDAPSGGRARGGGPLIRQARAEGPGRSHWDCMHALTTAPPFPHRQARAKGPGRSHWGRGRPDRRRRGSRAEPCPDARARACKRSPRRPPSPVQTLEPVHASAHHGAHRALSRRSSPCMHALTTAPHSPLRCACAPQP